jgi:hypothetical protein
MVKESIHDLDWTVSWNRNRSQYDDPPSPRNADWSLLVRTNRRSKAGAPAYIVHKALSPTEFKAANRLQAKTAVEVGRLDGKRLWWFRRVFYEADGDLTSEDVVALVLEAENKRRLRLEKAHALQAMRTQLDAKGTRQPIPQEVKVAVWQRDGGRCVECGSQQDLEYDHIIPLAMGGANTARNLQLLCAPCNRRKGATLG